MSDLVASVLLIGGSFFVLTAGIGILRFQQTLYRAHVISKALTLGLTLILIALFTVIGSIASGMKVIFAILFQFITIPIAAHIFSLNVIRDESGENE